MSFQNDLQVEEIKVQNHTHFKHDQSVKVWLWIGVGMIIIQVMIGGITRLTGSGLSITKWEIAVGTFPPMTAAAWDEAFDLYKETPQYHKINQGMSLSEFKFIYFWEYFHRLWARSLGFVFLLPFCWFLYKKRLSKALLTDLLVIVGLGAVVGLFGWIMVASGLVDRPWVNAYKLTLHLNLAFIVYAYLLWTAYKVSFPARIQLLQPSINRWVWIGLCIMVVQLILGGIVSGMKASLFFPTWPMMYGEYVPGVLTDASNWHWTNFKLYDSHVFAPAFFQFFHRNTGYILYLLMVILSIRILRSGHPNAKMLGSLGLISIHFQVLIGILVLLGSKGVIPVALGVLHQLGALAVISLLLAYKYFVGNTVLSAKN